MSDNKFHFLIGDVNYQDYGGKWYRKISDSTYHVIELVNIWDATGDEDSDKYNASLAIVNLESDSLESALSSSGLEDEDVNTIHSLLIVDALHSYGAYAPMGNWNGNNYQKLLKQAKDESHRLDDKRYLNSAMDRPVNKLGSTALEYMHGDFTSAIVRGIGKGDKDARIMGKIQGLSTDEMDSLESMNKVYNYDNFTLTQK